MNTQPRTIKLNAGELQALGILDMDALNTEKKHDVYKHAAPVYVIEEQEAREIGMSQELFNAYRNLQKSGHLKP